MKRIAFISIYFMSMVGLIAQPGTKAGWTWPEDDSLKSVAMEREAFYKVSMGLENWNDAYNALEWLWVNNPNLHQAIYQNGVKVFENLLKEDIAAEQKAIYRDSLLIMYDLRMANFGDSARVMDRKAYSAFKMYYKDRSKYALLADLYQRAYAINDGDVSNFNLIPYITLAKYYHQADPAGMPAGEVLNIHERVSMAIEMKIDNGGNAERLKNDQDKADAMLSSIEGILTCDFIESELVPRLEENPDDLNTAKKIFTYSLKAKCTDQPYFLTAGEVIYETDPTYELADALGDRFAKKEDTEKAIDFYEECLEMADEDEERYETSMDLAIIYSKMEDKLTSRKWAREALKIKPSDPEAYNLIGNLYFGSYEDCREGESRTQDRALFIAAYDMYKKAGNAEKMAETRAQFPSVEELFDENREKGDEITVNCWINQKVKLDTRD